MISSLLHVQVCIFCDVNNSLDGISQVLCCFKLLFQSRHLSCKQKITIQIHSFCVSVCLSVCISIEIYLFIIYIYIKTSTQVCTEIHTKRDSSRTGRKEKRNSRKEEREKGSERNSSSCQVLSINISHLKSRLLYNRNIYYDSFNF